MTLKLSKSQEGRKERIKQVVMTIKTLLRAKEPIELEWLINHWSSTFVLSKRVTKEIVEVALFQLNLKVRKGYVTK